MWAWDIDAKPTPTAKSPAVYPRRLNEAEVNAFTKGGPFLGTSTEGNPFNVEYHPNGTLDGVSGTAMDSGTWERVKDTVCIQWDTWRYHERYCVYLELLDDGSVQAIFLNGDRSSIFTGQVDWPKAIPTATSPAVKTPQPEVPGNVEERLAKLKVLLDKGLLTPDEATAKRKEILKGL